MRKSHSDSVDTYEISVYRGKNGIEYVNLTRFFDAADVGYMLDDWLMGEQSLRVLDVYERAINPYCSFPADIRTGREWIGCDGVTGIVIKLSKQKHCIFAETTLAKVICGNVYPELSVVLDRYFRGESRLWYEARKSSKAAYHIATDAVKGQLESNPDYYKENGLSDRYNPYAQLGDEFNVALFGQTAREWRQTTGIISKQTNQRDFASAAENALLAGLEQINAYLIETGVPHFKRIQILAERAKKSRRYLPASQFLIKNHAI